MSTKTTEEVFQEAVPRLFGFLVSEFGFSLTQEHDWLFEAQTEFAAMSIYLDRRTVVVAFRPFDEADRRLPESLKYLRGRGGAPDIAEIVHCLNPQVSRGFGWFSEPAQVEEELARYADLLRKYCTPFLKGDFAQWPKVEACLEGRTKKLRRWLETGDRSSLSD